MKKTNRILSVLTAGLFCLPAYADWKTVFPENTTSGAFLLRQEEQLLNFQLVFRNEKYQTIPVKKTDENHYSAGNQILFSQKILTEKKQAAIEWSYTCQKSEGVASAYISCKLPCSEWRGKRFSTSGAEFLLPSKPSAKAPRLWRGGEKEFLLGEGDSRLKLKWSRKCYAELYDLRVWNSPNYELRIYLAGQAADFQNGKTVSISLDLSSSPDFSLKEGATTLKEVHPITEEWTPFSIGWEEKAVPVWDFSRYYDAPAGKHGFVQVAGPVFQFANGKRLRMWGVNVASSANFPKKEDAAKVVGYLKRIGVNAIRFAHLDSTWYKSLINYQNKEKLDWHEDNFDKFFYFLNELKKAGIYYILDGRHGFEFMTNEFRFLDRFWRNRGCNLLLYFSPLMQAHHKKYLRKLLLTRNPYTGLSLAEDPALAGIQMLNETFLIRNGDYVKTQSSIPSPLQEDFLKAWNSWTPAVTGPKARRYDDASIPQRREFFSSLERRYFREMYRYYREDIGIKCPIAATSCYIGFSALPSAAEGDYTEGHSYYSLPKDEDLLSDENIQIETNKKLRLSRLPDSPGYQDNNFLRWLPFSLQQRIGYQPYIMGEWNHVHPFPERFDGPLWMTLLSNLQDFDGMFLFTIAHSPWETIRERNCDILISFEDPSTIINMIPAALVWHGRQLPPAQKSIEVRIPQKEIFEKESESYMLYGENMFTFRMYNCPDSPGMRHLPKADQILKPEERLKNVNARMQKAEEAKSPIRIHESHVVVDSPRFVSFFGNLGGKKLDAGIFSLTAPEGEEYSLSANSLDQSDLKHSGRILISICPVSLAQGSSFMERVDNTSGKRLARWMLHRRRNHPMVKPFQGEVAVKGNWKVYEVSNAGTRGKQILQSDSSGQVNWKIGGRNPVFFYLLERMEK